MGPGNQLGKPIPIAEVSKYTQYRDYEVDTT